MAEKADFANDCGHELVLTDLAKSYARVLAERDQLQEKLDRKWRYYEQLYRPEIERYRAALEEAETFIEKVVWETGFGGNLLEKLRRALNLQEAEDERTT